MAGQFINSPNHIIGRPYAEVADYPYDPPLVQDGSRAIFKGFRKVYLVINGVVADFYDWDKYGNHGRQIQQKAQSEWNIKWRIG